MKKGFTLIELLSVIVILAIIALIAIPQISNVVENAKKEAGARSVEGHIESINTELAKKMLLNNDLSDGEYSLTSLDIKTKGNTICTSYTIKSNTVISSSNCSSNGYIYSYNMENGAYILAGSKGSNADIYAKYNGRLHVTGSKLMNSKNQEFRLMGASNSEPPNNSEAIKEQGDKMYSMKSLATLKSWGANVFRIFMNKKYVTYKDDNHIKLMNDLKNAIDNLISNDMYIIINWSPGNAYTTEAKQFFNEISNMYKNDYHILYEIWNEPNDNSWNDVKTYANEVIPVIRKNSPDSIILVGSPKWDSRLDYVISDPLNYKNIMYTHHTYMNQVTQDHLNYLKQAINAGLPIFETECSATETGMPTIDKINPAHASAFFKYLRDNNISFTYFSWDSGMWAYNFVAYKKYKWDEELPESILRENAKYFKQILKGNSETGYYLMKENSNISNGKYYRSNEWKDKIVSVSFKNKKNIPKSAIISWDLSFLDDNSVIGYLTPSKETNMYDLVICADGYINLPTNSQALFKDLTNVKEYDFMYAKTDMVTKMPYMFSGNKSVEYLDLHEFNTDNLIDLGSTFSGCSSLKNLNINNWHPKLYDMVATFANCYKLESLDLSKFDVTNAKSFRSAFVGDASLKSLNISTWKPKKITNLNSSFASLSNIKELDLSGFVNFADECDFSNIFIKINPNVVIKTGNEIFKNDMKALYPNLNIQ